MYTRAVKTGSKLRLALAGIPGGGKTYTALTLAHALAGDGQVALIDTEAGRASKYADLFPPFDTVQLESFHPDLYIEAIHTAEAAGYAVLIIDSLSHAWDGPGGVLEIVDGAARASKSGSTFSAWADGTPVHNRLVNAIIRAKLHLICTMRSKMEYVQETDPVTHRTKVRRVGMAPIQRANFEYEHDIYAEMDDGTLTVVKSICPALQHAVIPYPDASLATTLLDWLKGEDAEKVELSSLMAQITTLRASVEEAPPKLDEMQRASADQLRKERDRLAGKLTRMKTGRQAS